MDLIGILGLIMQLIGIVSSILSIISFIFPTQAYPLVNDLRSLFNKRLLSNELLEINIIKNYKINKEISHEKLKADLKNVFNNYEFRSEIENLNINGNLQRRNLHIQINIELPTEDPIILFKQRTKIQFKNLYKAINTLFDLLRDFQRLNYVSIYDERVTIIVKCNLFSKNKFLKISRNYLKGTNFILDKNNQGEYKLTYTGLDNQETIDELISLSHSFVEV